MTKQRNVFAVIGLATLLNMLSACSSPRDTESPLQITPSVAEATPGDTIHFGATASGQPNAPVAWSVVEADGGTIDASGTYTAPEVEGTFHVLAFSSALSTQQLAAVSVWKHVRVAVTPQTATLAAGSSLTFAASVSGTPNKAVTWSVAEGSNGGAVTAAGAYTAPPTAGTYHVVATSAADSTQSASAAVTVTGSTSPSPATVSVAVAPQSASVVAGSTVQLAATVTGTTDTRVSWSVAEAGGGAVDQSGLYTAPLTLGTYHVVATSVADASKSATSTMSVTSTPPSPTPTPAPTGTQFYVATTGNDANAGTAAAPWRTIQKAMNTATPGSTVNIMAGTYHERLQLNVSGTATQPIIFQNNNFAPAGTAPGSGASGDVVVLDYAYLGTITDTVPALLIANNQYVTIQGLTFQNATYNGGGPQWGIRITGSNTHDIQFKYGKVLHFHESDVGVTALSVFYIDNGASKNLVYSTEFGDDLPAGSEMFTIGGASYNTVEKSYFHDTYNIALSVFCGPNYPGTTVGNVLRGNLLEYVGYHRDGSVLTDATYPSGSSAIYLNGPIPGTVVERNTIRNSSVGVNVDAESGNSWPAHDIVIRNNVIYADAGFAPAADMTGIKVGTYYSSTDGTRVYNVDILNNTVDHIWYSLMVRPYQSSTVRWENNAVTNSRYFGLYNALSWPMGGEANNLWYGNPSGTNGSGTGDVFANPLYVNPGAGDFSLSSSSPARDTGNGTTTSSDGSYGSSMNAGTVDHGGLPRVQGIIDIGANEVQ